MRAVRSGARATHAAKPRRASIPGIGRSEVRPSPAVCVALRDVLRDRRGRSGSIGRGQGRGTTRAARGEPEGAVLGLCVTTGSSGDRRGNPRPGHARGAARAGLVRGSGRGDETGTSDRRPSCSPILGGTGSGRVSSTRQNCAECRGAQQGSRAQRVRFATSCSFQTHGPVQPAQRCAHAPLRQTVPRHLRATTLVRNAGAM